MIDISQADHAVVDFVRLEALRQVMLNMMGGHGKGVASVHKVSGRLVPAQQVFQGAPDMPPPRSTCVRITIPTLQLSPVVSNRTAMGVISVKRQ